MIKSALIKLPLTTIKHLKTVVSKKISNLHHNLIKEKDSSRNILCFNPPFTSNVKTNNGKIFLRPLDKHFLKHHKYYKLFNRNDVKISYSRMQNTTNVIQNHTNLFTNLLKYSAAPTAKECSCRQKVYFPTS